MELKMGNELRIMNLEIKNQNEYIQLLKGVSKEDIEKYLMLKDPSIVGLLNPSNQSEVINIFEGKALPPCAEQPKEVKTTTTTTTSTPKKK